MNAKQREQYWRKFQLIRNDIEKKYINSIQKSIFAQFEGFAKDIDKIGVEASISKLGLNLWEKDLIKVFEAMYKESVVTFGNAVYRALKIEANQKAETFGFNAQWTKEILEFLMVKGFTLVSGITQTTKKRLIDIANAGVQEGLSVDDIVKLVLDDKELEYSNMRARRIVRTEIMRGSNIGAMKGAEAHGFQVDKQWISARDSRTRRIPDDEFDHVEVDGVVVPFDEPFTSNGKKGEAVVAMQPGDISAPAGFTINCRCTVGFIPKRDANGRLIMKPKVGGVNLKPNINFQNVVNQSIEVTKPLTKEYAEYKSGQKKDPIRNLVLSGNMTQELDPVKKQDFVYVLKWKSAQERKKALGNYQHAPNMMQPVSDSIDSELQNLAFKLYKKEKK
jgi:uncharacterized protein with gpF-like domain